MDNEQINAPSEATSTRQKWTVGLFAVSIGAAVVAIAVLVAQPDSPHVDLPTPVASSGTSQPPRPDSVAVVTPTVVFPTEIPGCDTVVPGSGHSVGFATADAAGYDNPKFPWFSGRKAVAMSDAARKALPTDVEIAFASPNRSLLFQPILNVPPNIEELGFSGWTDATASVERNGKHGSIRLEVRQSSTAAPPCIAGSVDRRITQSDGSVIDVDDSWVEYNGHRALRRSVRAYLTDGSHVSLSVDDENDRERELPKKFSGQLPLSVDEALRIVTDPGLRVHAAIPEGTPEPPAECGSASEDSGPDVDRETIERLNSVLEKTWRDGRFKPTLDSPLGSLHLADYSHDSLCEKLTVSSGASTAELTISIGSGFKRPKMPSDYDPERPAEGAEISMLPDGSVVEMNQRFVRGGVPSQVVTVTRASGTRVNVVLTGHNALLSTADLRTIASAPGLELSR